MMEYYEIAPISLIATDKSVLTYHAQSPLNIGATVRIPLGKKSANGIVLKKTNKPTFPTREILATHHEAVLPSALITTAKWMSEYYGAPMSRVLQTIVPRGLEKKRRAKIAPATKIESKSIMLSVEQQSALQELRKQHSKTCVLHGVTGSGKTQLYIERAKDALNNNKSTIVLVPEIGLTSQLVTAFRAHFKNVFVTHSHMSESERHMAWNVIGNSSEPVIVIGPRSALFSPRNDLGLIVIDEAHEPSYKQDQNPKYETSRVAAILAAQHKAQLILGSATPSVADMYLAIEKKAPVITLTKPVKAHAAAAMEIVNLKEQRGNMQRGWLSKPLREHMQTTLARGKQVLLFHNRRGTASLNLCNACGWTAECPTCFLPLTLHADQHALRCHICNHTTKPFTSCPECKNTDLIFKGMGTKQLEADVQSLFPAAKIARFDTDTHATESLEKRYNELHDGTINIIVGTQMIAKGLDLPNLELVGVPMADVGLYLPDFTASERTFQLLYQVAGRVGRHSATGKVIIQTYTPDHPAIMLAAAHNYDSFYTNELTLREQALYPPFAHMLKLTNDYASRTTAQSAAKKLAIELQKTYRGIRVLGPAPSFHERFNDRYRWQLVIKSKNRATLLNIATKIPQKWIVDIDPSNLL